MTTPSLQEDIEAFLRCIDENPAWLPLKKALNKPMKHASNKKVGFSKQENSQKMKFFILVILYIAEHFKKNMPDDNKELIAFLTNYTMPQSNHIFSDFVSAWQKQYEKKEPTSYPTTRRKKSA